MRNTIYPRHTIGNRGHEIFDLNSRQGLIQGVTKLHDRRKVKVSDIAPFDHLSQGETVDFDQARRIEVVDFGGWHGRGGFVSELHTQMIELEAGSIITGPIAWRTVADEEALKKNLNGDGEMSNLSTALFAGFILTLVTITALIMWQVAAMTVGMFLFLLAVVLVTDSMANARTRQIEKMGSVYILAPSSKNWGKADTADTDAQKAA